MDPSLRSTLYFHFPCYCCLQFQGELVKNCEDHMVIYMDSSYLESPLTDFLAHCSFPYAVTSLWLQFFWLQKTQKRFVVFWILLYPKASLFYIYSEIFFPGFNVLGLELFSPQNTQSKTVGNTLNFIREMEITTFFMTQGRLFSQLDPPHTHTLVMWCNRIVMRMLQCACKVGGPPPVYPELRWERDT